MLIDQDQTHVPPFLAAARDAVARIITGRPGAPVPAPPPPPPPPRPSLEQRRAQAETRLATIRARRPTVASPAPRPTGASAAEQNLGRALLQERARRQAIEAELGRMRQAEEKRQAQARAEVQARADEEVVRAMGGATLEELHATRVRLAAAQPAPESTGPDGLTPTERHVAASLGISAPDFLATKARSGWGGSTPATATL